MKTCKNCNNGDFKYPTTKECDTSNSGGLVSSTFVEMVNEPVQPRKCIKGHKQKYGIANCIDYKKLEV